MKKFIYMIIAGAAICACEKSIEIVDPYSSGVCVGMIELSAAEGSMSVSVETEGNWRVESDCDWLTLDTKGRNGNGAFTVYYDSNRSDGLSRRATRIARVQVRLEDSMKTDTLVFVQQGLYPADFTCEVTDDPALRLEWVAKEFSQATLICCSSEGSGNIDAWLSRQSADVIVKDGIVTGEIEEIKVEGCCFDKNMTVEQEYQQFRSIIDRTYNGGPDAGDNWIIAGQMYHLSVMQTDYDATPLWYPEKSADAAFRSDLYAWNNNLYDCVWMYSQEYISTYTEGGRSWSADYVYASESTFDKITSVELIEIEGLSHKAIKLTFKY